VRRRAAKRPATTRGPRYDESEVRDLGEFFEVVEELVSKLGEGLASEAAREMGISQPTLSRLRRPTPRTLRTLSRATEERLVAAALRVDDQYGTSLARRLLSAIDPPEARRVEDGYEAWRDERRLRYARAEGPAWVLVDRRPKVQDLGPSTDAMPVHFGNLGRVLNRVAKAYPHLTQRFQQEMTAKGVEPERIQLALIRVVEPLVEASRSAFVERTWGELTPREREKFVEWGLRRERIMLRRATARERARARADGTLPLKGVEVRRTVNGVELPPVHTV